MTFFELSLGHECSQTRHELMLTHRAMARAGALMEDKASPFANADPSRRKASCGLQNSHIPGCLHPRTRAKADHIHVTWLLEVGMEHTGLFLLLHKKFKLDAL